MLVVYFCAEDSKAWLVFFLVSTVAFGLLTYMIVGGTRANIVLRLLSSCLSALFGAGSAWMLVAAGVLGIVGMFWLALKLRIKCER